MVAPLPDSLRELLDGDQPVGLVAQGGGMRGIYSAAALAELERQGYGQRFSDVYGTSSGALNAAYLVAGQSHLGPQAYAQHLSGRRFISPRRVHRILDIDFLIDEVFGRRLPLNLRALRVSPSKWHAGMCRVRDGRMVWADNRSDWPVLEVLRAAAAVPVAYGREVEIRGERYVDGGLLSTVPLERALADGHRNLLVVLTRPHQWQSAAMRPRVASAVRLGVRATRHSPSVAQLMSQRDARPCWDAAQAVGCRVWVVAPSAPIVSRMSRDRASLEASARLARQDTLRVLDGGEFSSAVVSL